MSNQNHPEYQYLNLLKDIKKNGSDKKLFFTPEVLQDYAKKGEEPPCIRSVFGRQIRFDLSKGFPLLTTKKVFIRGIIIELLWFLRGDTNIKFLVDNNVHIWDEWAYKRYRKQNPPNPLYQGGKIQTQIQTQIAIPLTPFIKGENSNTNSNSNSNTIPLTPFIKGENSSSIPLKGENNEDIGQEKFIEKIKNESADSDFVKKWGDLICVYGKMWRKWPASDGREIDQLGWCIQGLKEKPFRKSYVVSAWNPDFIYAMASSGNANEVPPFCHTTFQFQVTENGILNLGLYQRSADVFLGVPFNIASYSLLLLMVAQITGLKPGEFVHTFGDVHIYSNHFDAVNEQLSREPKPFPIMKLNPEIKNIDDFKYEDFILENYDPHPAIKAEIANIGGF